MARRGEFETIAALFRPLTRGHRAALNLVDDVAVLSPMPSMELIVTADQLVVGVHTLGDEPAGLVAKKALRRNLSDLAAKGAKPLGYFLTIARPKSIADRWLDAFAKGLAEDGEFYRLPLLGGDTTATPGPFSVSITAIGETPKGTMIPRGGAKPGDDIWVTGTIGDAAIGLDTIRAGTADAHLKRRYRVPEPRVAFGPSLRGLAHAAIDVSDGLLADLGHLARVSRVAADIDATAVPRSPSARKHGDLARALTGGDDYEILFAAPQAAAAKIRAAARRANTAVTCIGTIVTGKAGAIRVAGATLPRARAGFTHF
jgi:thiamine-monophosphate kinase